MYLCLKVSDTVILEVFEGYDQKVFRNIERYDGLIQATFVIIFVVFEGYDQNCSRTRE